MDACANPLRARRLECTVEQYHRDELSPKPTLSCSVAKTIVAKSPLHAYAVHPRFGGVERETTPEMDFGTTVHSLVLGKGSGIQEITFPDFRTNLAKEARNAARNAGLVPVLSKHLRRAKEVAENITEQLARRGVVFGGESEVAIEWEEESARGPILCRSMLDHYIASDGLVIDLKTTGDANPEAFGRKAIEMGYDLQSVVYPRALEVLRPELAGRVEFLFAVVEVQPPFAVLVGQPAGDMRRLGELRWRRAVETWATCLEAQKWPGYGDGIAYLGLPGWAAKLIDEEETMQ